MHIIFPTLSYDGDHEIKCTRNNQTIKLMSHMSSCHYMLHVCPACLVTVQ